MTDRRASRSTTAVPPGTRVIVEVPATSANLGPGFDCFGLALDWRDRVQLEVVESGFGAEVTGEGSGRLPTDASHLIVAAALTGLDQLGRSVPGLKVRSHNTIPHARGLGSSSAAIVAGLAGALALAGQASDREWLLRGAAAIEGHPDNVAAAIWGGFVLAYADAEAGADRWRAAQARVARTVRGVVFIPETAVSTQAARGLLPERVPHGEAAATAGRAGLFVHAVAADPELLFAATREWLHQDYRRPVMPDSAALLARLRADRHAAVISGAGPTVLVLGTSEALRPLLAGEWPGFTTRPVRPGPGVRVVG